MDVVVVGTGIAGLIAALEASRRHTVTLVTKAELAESNTRYAQGGIAAVMFPDDSVEAHIADTLAAGAGLGDPEAVRILCTEGPDRIRDLIALGVAFDREGGELARGHEAAHSNRRVLHAGGDATGLAVELALVRAVRAAAVEILEHTFMSDLVVEDGRVAGIEVILLGGEPRRIPADRVILASGGAGQLFSHTTNPPVATGDGVAAALRAGAAVRDVEFYQFHPTSLAVPGSPLVSEAVRGEGAVLRDAEGVQFMTDVHPDAELAPRDVVARGIAARMAEQGGTPVLLDAAGLARKHGSRWLTERFPGITRITRENGLDWTSEPIPVTPAAHYWMGGIATDAHGRTSLDGLFAVGEVAATGVHGANRLASNSLLESVVFAWRAAAALDAEWEAFEPISRDLGEGIPGPGGIAPPLAGYGTRFSRAELQNLMWTTSGLYRSRERLEVAAAALATWSAAGDAVADREDANLLELARVVVSAALTREESRGAHFRSDFPDADPAFARHLTLARKVAVASC